MTDELQLRPIIVEQQSRIADLEKELVEAKQLVTYQFARDLMQERDEARSKVMEREAFIARFLNRWKFTVLADDTAESIGQQLVKDGYGLIKGNYTNDGKGDMVLKNTDPASPRCQHRYREGSTVCEICGA